jgi:hypothetical protein
LKLFQLAELTRILDGITREAGEVTDRGAQ